MSKQVNRRDFLKAAGAAAGAAAVPEWMWAGRKRKPNVIVLYIDDLNFDSLSCYGGKTPTPNIDKLAKEGMKFHNGYVSSAVCTPSRFSVLTGLYASRARALKKDFPKETPAKIAFNTYLVDGDQTLPMFLQNSGYATGMVGKWHLGGYWGGKISAHEDPFNPITSREMRRMQRGLAEVVKTRGFDYAASLYLNNPSNMPIPTKSKFHNMEWLVAGAREFIEENKDMPFFLHFSTTLPHAPGGWPSLEADPRITPGGILKEAPQAGMAPREEIIKRTKDSGSSDWKAPGIVWLDEGIGALMSKLDELKLSDDTAIILISDNQDPRGKMTCYDAARVPYIVRWPGVVKAGSENNSLVSNLDVLPTVLEMAGAELPQGQPADGVSIVPLLKGEKYQRDDLMLEVNYTRAVVDKDGWKYVAVRVPDELRKKHGAKVTQGGEAPDKVFLKQDEQFPGYYDPDQLYNLKEDPQEQVNLAGDNKHAKVLARLKKRMGEYAADLPHAFGEFKN
jgi:arylsulfatase A-like enzyme